MGELMLAELKRAWIQYIRYPAEVLGGIVIITGVFYGLFLSTRYMAGASIGLGNRLDAMVVGYVLWSLVLFIINDVAINLQLEAQTGTLEQVFLSPFGASRVFFARAIASLILRLTLMMVILAIIMGITGSRLSFPATLFLPLMTLLMAGYGLAFAMGAGALIFKRVQQVLGVFQFVLLFLVAAPIEEWSGLGQWFAYGLPMLPSTSLLRSLMALDANLDRGLLAIATLNGGLYLTLGLSLFRWAEQEAKRRGNIGGY